MAKCGTASPTNAIGPAKAVMLPAKMLVANMIVKRVFLKFKPKLRASFSPNSNAFQGLMHNMLVNNPINTETPNIQMESQDRFPRFPNDQKVNFCNCSTELK